MVNIDDEVKKRKVNNMIKIFKESKFIVRMFPAAANPKSQYYICLEMEQEDIEIMAEKQCYLMKMFDDNLKFRYVRAMKDKFEPFRSKDVNAIMDTIVFNVTNIPDLMRKKVVVAPGPFQIHQLNEIADIQDKF